jgi:hypothetical protein
MQRADHHKSTIVNVEARLNVRCPAKFKSMASLNFATYGSDSAGSTRRNITLTARIDDLLRITRLDSSRRLEIDSRASGWSATTMCSSCDIPAPPGSME